MRQCALWLLLALALAGCNRAAPRVDAADYDSFWLWAGVQSQPVLAKAKTVYLLEGEIRDEVAPQLTKLRPGTPRVKHAELWIVYRVETLRWSDDIVGQMRGDLARWRAAGNRVKGIQIDFDARTRGLSGYASFLRGLKAKLPSDVQLSITGLLDWSAQGDSAALNALGGSVDEIIIQTYQGRSTVAGYEAYMDGLSRLKRPFKVGLVQGGEWREPSSLKSNPNFKGYAVFLLNDKSEPGPDKSGPGR